MKASERKIMEIRDLAEASAESLEAVAKASHERLARRQESRKIAAKVSGKAKTR